MGPIDAIFQPYEGAFQDRGTRTGTDALFDKLYALHPRGLYTCLPLRHNSRYKEDVAYNARHLADGGKHYVEGYSKGGETAVKYCWHAQKFAIEIDILFLIDAVKIWWGDLQIPSNVKRCVWWYQRNDKPDGDTVRPAKNNTRTEFDNLDGYLIDLPHVAMEDYGFIQNRIRDIVKMDLIP